MPVDLLVARFVLFGCLLVKCDAIQFTEHATNIRRYQNKINKVCMLRPFGDKSHLLELNLVKETKNFI